MRIEAMGAAGLVSKGAELLAAPTRVDVDSDEVAIALRRLARAMDRRGRMTAGREDAQVEDERSERLRSDQELLMIS